MVIRRISVPPGAFADTDWLEPGVMPPDNARRFKITGELRFAIRGRASSAPDAEIVSLGAMTLDAYVLIEILGGGSSRGKSVVEVEDSSLQAQVLLASSSMVGAVGRLHLTLGDVSAPVVEVLLVGGGRVL